MDHNRYTDGQYLDNNPTWHVEDSRWKSTEVLKMLNRHQLQPHSVCEVGCGAGEILRLMQENLPDTRFEGWDISPQAMVLAQERSGDRLRFVHGDFLQSEDTYELVMALDVFEHVEDYLGFLRQLNGRGRYTLFHIPLDLSVQAVARGLLMRWREDVGHLHYFTRELALTALKETGYEILDAQYTTYAIDRPAPTFKARLARKPRRLAFCLAPHWTARTLGGFCLMVLTRSSK